MSRIFDALNKARMDSSPAAIVRSLAADVGVVKNVSPHVFEVSDFPVRPWRPDSKQLLFASASEEWYGLEQFRRLRSRLCQLSSKSSLKTLLVSSALAEEGKTFVSANLALALAKQNENKVLLVDGDLRKPSLHRLLGAPDCPGLADLLAGRVDLPEAVQAGAIENLWFLPGGTPPENAAELLGRKQLTTVWDQLTAIFDWIIVDSSPVLPVSDATVLSRLCNGVLLVTRANSTPYTSVQQAIHEFSDAPLLGVVLNRAKELSHHSSYYYSRYAYKDNREVELRRRAQ